MKDFKLMFQKLSLLPSAGTDVVNKKKKKWAKESWNYIWCVSANMSESLYQPLMIKAETASSKLELYSVPL
jgi:hypothetical protein